MKNKKMFQTTNQVMLFTLLWFWNREAWHLPIGVAARNWEQDMFLTWLVRVN